MATPYLQLRFDLVPSTQDVARENLDRLPVVVMAPAQSAGRGRSGAEWTTAPRALAVSLAFRPDVGDHRPFSLMAGLAASRVTVATTLKWPNDLMLGENKVGGTLVESSDGVMVIGQGINLWWPDAPAGMAGIFGSDPGPERHLEIGSIWGAEMIRLIDGGGWPRNEYKAKSATLGKALTWEPGGSGVAFDIEPGGGLVVDTDRGRETIYSGAVRHVRPS